MKCEIFINHEKAGNNVRFRTTFHNSCNCEDIRRLALLIKSGGVPGKTIKIIVVLFMKYDKLTCMSDRVKRIAVLGSTGSIGLSSLDVIESLGNDFQLISAGAHRQWRLLARQARRFHLLKVVITDNNCFEDLKNELADTDTVVLAGPERLTDLAKDKSVDTVGRLSGNAPGPTERLDRSAYRQ